MLSLTLQSNAMQKVGICITLGDYNVGGLVAMINGLCYQRKSLVLVEVDVHHDNATKRRRIEKNELCPFSARERFWNCLLFKNV